jgi:methylmalonyl-CoA/ethylmalonyl-CoA epimerase
MMTFRDLGIAVKDLDAAMNDLRNQFGMEPRYIQSEDRPPIQVRAALYSLETSGLSLMASSEEGSPIDRFLKRRGEGVFSVSVQVDDIDVAVADMRSKGVEFVLDEPVVMNDFMAFDGIYKACRMNFTRPSTTHGVVFEVQQLER